jgi:hypothetical protein
MQAPKIEKIVLNIAPAKAQPIRKRFKAHRTI